MVVVEPFKRGVKQVEGVFSEDVFTCNITEVKEGIERLGEIRGDKAFECVHKDL